MYTFCLLVTIVTTVQHKLVDANASNAIKVKCFRIIIFLLCAWHWHLQRSLGLKAFFDMPPIIPGDAKYQIDTRQR